MGIVALCNDISKSYHFSSEIDETIVEKTQNIFCMPLKTRTENEILGVLQLCNKKNGNFDNHDEFLITLICTQLCVVIQNILQKQKLKEKIDQYNALLDVSKIVTSKLDTNQVVSSILSTVKRLVGADRASLFEIDNEKKEISTCIDGKKIFVEWGKGVVSRVIQIKKTINVPDTKKVEFWDSSVDKLTKYHTQSILAVPIFDKNDENEIQNDNSLLQVIGVIQMVNKIPKKGEEAFNKEDMFILESFSHFISISLNNSRLYGKSLKKEQTAVKLLDAFKELSSLSLELNDLLFNMVENARTLIAADRGSVFLIDHEKNELFSTHTTNNNQIEQIRLPIGKGIAGYVAKTGEIVNIVDAYEDSRFYSNIDKKFKYTTKSILCVPIYNKSHVIIGVTQMINKIKGDFIFTKEDEDLLCKFAKNASIFIQNAQRYQNLKTNELIAKEKVKRKMNQSINNEIKSFVDIIINRAVFLTNASSGNLYLLNSNNDEYTLLNNTSKASNNPEKGEEEEETELDSIITKQFLKQIEKTSKPNLLNSIFNKFLLFHEEELILKETNKSITHYKIFYKIYHNNVIIGLLQLSKFGKSFDNLCFDILNELGQVCSIILSKILYFDVNDEKQIEDLNQFGDMIQSSRLYQITEKKLKFLKSILSYSNDLFFGIDHYGNIQENNLDNSNFKYYGLPFQEMKSFPCTQWVSFSNKNNSSFFNDILSSHTTNQPICNKIIIFHEKSSSFKRTLKYSIIPWNYQSNSNEKKQKKQKKQKKTKRTNYYGIIVMIQDISEISKVGECLQYFNKSIKKFLDPNVKGKSEILYLFKKIQEIYNSKRILYFNGSTQHTLTLKYHFNSETSKNLHTGKNTCTFNKQIISKVMNTKQIQILQTNKQNDENFTSQIIEISEDLTNIQSKLNEIEKSDTNINEKTLICLPLLTSDEIILGILYIDEIPFSSISSNDFYILSIFSKLLNYLFECSKGRLSPQNSHAVSSKQCELLNEQIISLNNRVTESEKVKAAFLMNMSHELRTPLNSIIGIAELLLSTKLNKQQSQFINNILTSSSSLLEIINQILDFTKISNPGSIQLDSKLFDLRATLEDTISILSEKYQEKNIEICLDMLPNEICSIIGDPHRVRQIFESLLSNALKFSNKNSHIFIQVRRKSIIKSTKMKKFNEHKFHFKVIDFGVGMSKKEQEKLFEPFSQIDTSTTRRYEGIGIGLVICKYLIELMKGELFIHSNPNQGTEVSFQCCFCSSNNQEISKISNEILSFINDKNVLLISSFASNNLLESILKFYNMNVYSYSSFIEFQESEIDKNIQFSFIIADYDILNSEICKNFMNSSSNPFSNFYKIILSTKRKSFQDDSIPVIFIPLKLNQVINCFSQICSSGKVSISNSPCLSSANKNNNIDTNILCGDIKTLLVEDNRMNRIVIKKQLQRVGIIPDIAENGKIAVEKFIKNDYHIILMDCHMPVMDGYTATREIRALECDKDSRVIIVALTADALTGTRDECLAAGMDDYYTKPLSHKVFVEIVNKFFPAQ